MTAPSGNISQETDDDFIELSRLLGEGAAAPAAAPAANAMSDAALNRVSVAEASNLAVGVSLLPAVASNAAVAPVVLTASGGPPSVISLEDESSFCSNEALQNKTMPMNKRSHSTANPVDKAEAIVKQKKRRR